MSAAEVFPVHFDPSRLEGPRAYQHPKRNDAFQQLVGDGLREVFGNRVSVAPTEGRDGSIDIFVDVADAHAERYHGLPLPLIVECKDHDDGSRGVIRNVYAGWAEVQRKLAATAAEGWPGKYAPWKRAKGYLYCVSARLNDQQVRDDLTLRITDFFNALPEQQKPPIEQVRVMDWSDLRGWLDSMQRVVDRWLGVRVETILPYDRYLERLTGFRTFLLPEHLSFVAPPEGDPAHPDRVLHAVTERAGKGGIIIVGAGGVGKTRTSLEIAIRAERQGWRVLHVLPGEPGATVEDLAQVMFPGDRATLVVFDYLDQMQRLDMGALRHRLIPEAGARGMRLALLANARPGGLRLRNDERDAVFARVELNPAETQRHQISVRVQQQVAPMANAILGAARVQILCGERPIIAMFIARELERRAQEGTLDEPSLAGLRAGELSGWLRRRLAEDRLLAPDSGAFLPPTPEPSVVAAATALAVAPLPLNMLTAAVALTLEAAEPAGRVQTDRVIRMLLALRWLEQRDNHLAAAHDVVADEVLEQALWERPGDAVRTLVFDQVLSAPLQFARCLGRLAVTLSRLLGPTPSSQAFKGALQAAAVAWLATHADALGRTLAEEDPDEVSFALGAALRVCEKIVRRGSPSGR